MTLTAAPPRLVMEPTARVAWRPQPPALAAARPPRTLRSTVFVPKREAELARLGDEDLVRYVARAKAARALDHARLAMHLLLYRHERRIRRRVQLALPEFLAHHSDAVEAYVLDKVWKSALELPLKGESAGEWVNWWKRVVARQVVSFWRSSQGQALERETPWPSKREDDEGARRPDPIGQELDVDQLVARIDYAGAIAAVLATMNAEHAAIIEAAYFEDRPSKDVATEFGVTVNNVDKIKERFREALRAELERRGMGR